MPFDSVLSKLRFLRPCGEKHGCAEESVSNGWGEVRCGQREWEEFYRRRWQYDKKVRSTHGVNCTGSCSWDVYVKNGIIVWETQRTDYPSCGAGFPNHEPRGCPRGATYSWYTYSPVRLKHPLVRSTLLEMWREALAEHADPVAAWRGIVADEAKRNAYQAARGKGGFVRVSWDEAATLVAASLIHTIQAHGPDRIFGFTPIPAMSMVCYASGARFLSLIGGVLASFYDWYCDLPPASPQMWGEQTDVPESADWYESSYMIVWGTNLPMTRTPDAHFFTEARYRGARVAAVAPDYAEYVKFADTWLPAKAGTDAALAMAMSHVILKEFYVDRQSEYFAAYAKAYTDLPFAVVLEEQAGNFTAGRFLRASDLGHTSNNAPWKTVLCDAASDRFVVPNGSIGFRWSEEGRWNLNLKDSATDAAVDPLLSFASSAERWVRVHSPLFEVKGAGTRAGVVPVREVQTPAGPVAVTTVFDLLAAHLGVRRKESDAHPQDYPSGYEDPQAFTPAWQEAITGVPAADAIRVAREFAENAEKTRGKSMIFLGAGTNHWFHSDMIYRAILNLTTLCGCQGVNGGGWAHYVGQEKVRPQAAWSQVAFGLDWRRPPRQQNGTSLWYFATDQWRYDTLDLQSMASPLTQTQVPRHPADCNAIAARLGWLPSFPQFDRNPIELVREAVAAGAATDAEIVGHVVARLKTGEVRFAVEDPDHPANFPRVLFLWRANLLGASSKGHEYFMKHLLGVDSAVLNTESPLRPEEIVWREHAPEGKLDLLVTMEIRMSTSALYADVALPAAGWYEMHDLNTTDMHPFIHPFNPAVDPPWEARTNWDQFKTIAAKFSELAAVHLREAQRSGGRPAAARQPRRDRAGRGAGLAQGRVRAGARQDHAQPDGRLPRLRQRLPHDDGPGAAGRPAGGGLQGDHVDGRGGIRRAQGDARHGGRSRGEPGDAVPRDRPAGGRDDPHARSRDQRSHGDEVVEAAGEAHRAFPQPPERRPPQRKVRLRRPDGPAAQDHHVPGLERNRVRRTALLALRDQHRRESALPDADRPGPLLPGPPVDAALRRGAPGVPPARGHVGPRLDRRPARCGP